MATSDTAVVRRAISPATLLAATTVVAWLVIERWCAPRQYARHLYGSRELY